MNSPLVEILHSHMHISHQEKGNGKELQQVKIKTLYNIINDQVVKYNEIDEEEPADMNASSVRAPTAPKTKKYGHNFEFISIDEIVVRIIRMSNRLLIGDYGIVGRRGSEVEALVRLVSYIQGFKYHEKPVGMCIVDVVKGIIPKLTKCSSNLLAIKLKSDEDLQQLIDFYDADFEIEIVIPVLENELEAGPNNISGGHPARSHTPSRSNQKNKSYLKNSGATALANTETTSSASNNMRVVKPSFKDIRKIKNCIRIVAEFSRDPTKISTKSWEQSNLILKESILSQMRLDFFEEYPE